MLLLIFGLIISFPLGGTFKSLYAVSLKKYYAIFFKPPSLWGEGRCMHTRGYECLFDLDNLHKYCCCSDDPQPPPPPPPPRFDKKKRKPTVDHNPNKLDQVDEQDEELVYCTKGSLCSRRSKATLLSTSTRNIKGHGLLITCKVKQRPAVNNALIPPSNCTSYYGTQFLSKTQQGALHLTQHILQTTHLYMPSIETSCFPFLPQKD